MGILLIVFAVFADRSGIGRPGGFGSGQFLLILFGGIFLLLSFLWKKFTRFYQFLAVLILNTVLLIAIMEFGSIVVGRLNIIPTYRSAVFATYPGLPYYSDQDWTETDWNETLFWPVILPTDR